MGIIISDINDIAKYNPYVDLNEFRNDEYFEAKFLEYFQDFLEQVNKLKDKLNHKSDKKIDDLFEEIVRKKNDEYIKKILDEYFYCLFRDEDVFRVEEEIVKLKQRVRLVKDLILISESANMRRLQEIDDLVGNMIDEVSSLAEFLDDRKTKDDMLDDLIASFNPEDDYSLDEYNTYVLLFRKSAEELCNYYRNNYSVKMATSYINKLNYKVDELLDNEVVKLGLFQREEECILELVNEYERKKCTPLCYNLFISSFRDKIEKLKLRFVGSYSSEVAKNLIKLLDKKTGEVFDKKADLMGMPSAHELRLDEIFDWYRPEKLDIFDIIFYSSYAEKERAEIEYKQMTPEEQAVFEIRIYEQYIRMFKEKIRALNNNVRNVYSVERANKLVDFNNKKADQFIRYKAKKLGKPIPKNPWFVRKYLWADTENFLSERGLKVRKLINPLLRQIVKVAMNNEIIMEEQGELDPTKEYIYVPTHYFTEDAIGMFASLNRQACMLMGTTDQIENNPLMAAAVMFGFFHVDRLDSGSRSQCVDKQNRIIDYGTSFINYVSGSWENSENELQPLSFSGPYRTAVAKGVQIVPVGLYLVREEKKIYVRYGDPIDVSKYDENTANMIIRDTLASMHFKQMSKYSIPIETIDVEGYGKTHNLPYDQHTYYMDQIGNEYWNQYWSKPFAKEEIGLRPKKVTSLEDAYAFVDNLSRESLIKLSGQLSEPMVRRFERDERFNIVKYLDEHYDSFRESNGKGKTRKRVKEK